MNKQSKTKKRLKQLAAGWRKAATVAVGALAVAVGYHVVLGKNGVIAYQHKREETRSLDQQMKVLARENDQLQGHVDRLETDPSAIEHEAREELHYTRPGEVIYTLPAKAAAANSSSAVVMAH